MSFRQFMQAAVRGDVEYLQTNVETYAGQRDPKGRTALMLSALTGQTGAIEVLRHYEEGQRDQNGATALIYASGSGCSRGVKILASGPEIKMQTNDGTTAAMCAAARGFSACLKYLKPEFGLQNKLGQTALMLASAQDHIECVQMLKDAEFYSVDREGKNALMYACASGRLNAVQALLCNEDMTDVDAEHPYRYGAKSSSQKTALRAAFDAMQYVSQLPEDDGRAYAAEVYQIASALLEEEGSVVTGTEQSTILMLSAACGADEFVERLLPTQQNLQDARGRTALMYASGAGHVSTVRLLEREQRIRDKEGLTALMHAVRAKELEAAQVLLQAEVELKDTIGNTVLHVAAAAGCVEVVSAVKKLFLGVVNTSGDPALFAALKQKHLPCARLLLEEAGIVGHGGKTALMAAAASGAAEIVDQLASKQRGKTDERGWNASCWAAHGDQLEILPNLLSTESQKAFPVLFAAVEGDAPECTKFMADIARSGGSELFGVPRAPPDLVKLCKKQMELRAKKLIGVYEGDNALQHAVRLGKSAATRILAPVLRQPELYQNGFTPLMTAATTQYENGRLTKEAIKALCTQFAGRQLTQDMPGIRVGATALMIGALSTHDNLDVLLALIPYERDCRDSDGKTALDYARVAERDDLIAVLRTK